MHTLFYIYVYIYITLKKYRDNERGNFVIVFKFFAKIIEFYDRRKWLICNHFWINHKLYNFCKTFERNYRSFHCLYNFNII